MSRSGYSDDCEHLELYRANVHRMLRGKAGQKFLIELAAALDAMPVKELIAGELVAMGGACCTLGAVCITRQLDTTFVDYEDPDSVAKLLNIPRMMAAEAAYMNDAYSDHTPATRWTRMRAWVAENITQ